MRRQEVKTDATHNTEQPTSESLPAGDVREGTKGKDDAGKRVLHPRVKALIRRYGGKVQFGGER